MKLRNVTRLGALALTLTMVTTCLLGGTLAKYTTTVSGTDSVTVAKFGYEANDGANDIEFTTGDPVDIDLFDNLKTNATGTIAYDEDENDTVTTGDMMLAPGAYGSFDIQLDGTLSDVDIEMSGSKVTATAVANGSVATSGAIYDKFISYTITYKVTDTTTETTAVLETYDVERVSMFGFASDLQSVLEDIVLEKNTVGTITVQYAWVDGDTGTYDAQDTALIQAWQGYTIGEETASTLTNPSFTLTINNTASQVVAPSGSTTAVTYTKEAIFDAGDTNGTGTGLYTVDGGVVNTEIK